jgi:CheY-like chemotaxis protein
MDDLNTKTKPSGGYYYYNKSERIFCSYDPKYYDQIITKLNLQTREEYERAAKYSHKQKVQDRQVVHSQTKKRVLLVDDEPDICMVYQMVLEDAGYECIPYTDPVKALQEFRPDYYDLIILDIKMPVLNGFELCKKIREVDKAVHIIFITALEEYRRNVRGQLY